MASGKSTSLARFKLHTQFDLDRLIEQKFLLSPGKMIEKFGEDYFREREKSSLREHLENAPCRWVLALGGGALYDETLAMIRSRPNIQLVFLNTPFEICCQRATLQNGDRPLFHHSTERELRQLYDKRMPFYLKADVVLNNDEDLEKFLVSQN